jgi:hypothetical protein
MACVTQDISPFAARPPRRPRRRRNIGGIAALLAVLGLALATWALGNSDGVVPPTDPAPAATPRATGPATGAPAAEPDEG